ncbi:hypothetical protein M427DRAFT_273163 [Gonapodya prolifera JEL478]|uniref:Uncharacterized protein n=1 Tax=Gonapodya prolifera (strain JEL478) TaxID=1344416 RepID=A0A139AXS6_GONPJ|nr:hypothetical protein M427DRAFT_273163 [Gonapodya prolifera JEL478]|eukprot:KXS21551.1 hypothetical protein M427DRAFT_273163 [Gonapodya prolifera JEL478]
MFTAQGQVVIDDFRRLLSSLKRVINEKNEEEDIQSFIFHSRMATVASRDALLRTSLYEGGKSVGQVSQEGFSAASTIARLLVTNNEFRQLLLDLSEIFQDVLVGFTERRCDRARRGIEGPSDSEVTYGEEASHHRRQDTSRTLDDRDYDIPRRVKRQDSALSGDDDFRRGRGGFSREFSHSYYQPTEIQVDGGEAETVTPVAEASAAAASVAPPFVGVERFSVPTVAKTVVDKRDYPSPPRSAYPERESLGRTYFRRTTDEYVERDLPATFTQEERGSRPERKTSSYVDDAADVIAERLSVEKRQRLVDRFRRICEDLSGNEGYRSSIKYLLSMLERLASATVGGGQDVSHTVARRVRKDANLLAAEFELKSLVEKFANGHSLDPILDQLKEFAQQVSEDFYLRDYLRDLKEFVYQSLENPAYLTTRDYDRRGGQFINRGRSILFEKYRNDTANLVNCIKDFTHELQSDRVTRDFADDVSRITRDMLLNEEGQYEFKPDLIRDFTTIILPLLFDQVKYIPIPRIEHNDDRYHIILENLIITSENFLPNVLEVKMKNAVVMGLRKSIDSSFNSHFTINFYQTFADIRDVPFYVKRKKGFPRMSDHGVLSMFVGGQGVSILVKLGLVKDDPRRTLFVRRIRTHVDDLRIDIRGEKHEALYTIFSPIIHQVVRSQIQKTIESTIRDWIGYLDENITGLKNNLSPQINESLGEMTSARGAMGRFVDSLNLGSSTKGSKPKSARGEPTRETPSFASHGFEE